MNYNNLYIDFKKRMSEDNEYFQKEEYENLIDNTVGIHIAFGMVVVPYILLMLKNNDKVKLDKIFDFIEEMSICDDVKVQEVLDFTVLESLIDTGNQELEQIKKFMKENTLKHCEKIEEYFY